MMNEEKQGAEYLENMNVQTSAGTSDDPCLAAVPVLCSKSDIDVIYMKKLLFMEEPKK